MDYAILASIAALVENSRFKNIAEQIKDFYIGQYNLYESVTGPKDPNNGQKRQIRVEYGSIAAAMNDQEESFDYFAGPLLLRELHSINNRRMVSCYNAKETSDKYRKSLLKVAESFQILRGLSSILAMPECIEYELILTMLSELDLPEAEGKSREDASTSPQGQTSNSTSSRTMRALYPLDAILGKHIELKGVFSALLNGKHLENLRTSAENAGIDLTKPHRRVQVESEEPRAEGLGAIVAPRVMSNRQGTKSLTLVHANFGGEISADSPAIEEPKPTTGEEQESGTAAKEAHAGSEADETNIPGVQAGPYLQTTRQTTGQTPRTLPHCSDSSFSRIISHLWRKGQQKLRNNYPNLLINYTDLLGKAIELREFTKDLGLKNSKITSNQQPLSVQCRGIKDIRR